MLMDDWLWWAGLLAVLVLWSLGVHNRVTALKAAVLGAWAQMDALLRERAQALASLLQAVETPLASESAALGAVQAAQAQTVAAADVVRRGPVVSDPAADPVADLAKADAVLAAVMVRLLALVEQQPALLADTAVAGPLAALKALPARLDFARQLFNTASAAYNGATQQFPTRLLRSLLRFGRAGRL